jgi:hypothetical protein
MQWRPPQSHGRDDVDEPHWLPTVLLLNDGSRSISKMLLETASTLGFGFTPNHLCGMWWMDGRCSGEWVVAGREWGCRRG